MENRPANVTAAKEHFVSAVVNRTAEIANMSKGELFTYGLNWLENAQSLAETVSNFDSRHYRTEVNHQSSWYKAFKNFVEMAS